MSKPESKKRQLDKSTELDDSIASIRSDLLADKEPTMKDIAVLLIRLIDRTESTRAVADDANERARLAEHNCEQLHRRATEIENKSETQQQEIRALEKKANDHEASLHKIEQERVDKDIFLSGFPIKPDHKKVAAKFTQIYGIEPEMIADSYQFEFKSKSLREAGPSASSTLTTTKNETVYHHVVISLKEKKVKFELMKNKREDKGPLLYEQIDEFSRDDRLKKAIIRCSHRLSKFNLAVQSRLLKAKSESKIQLFQLHNGLFRYKKDENSKWNVIDTEASLNNLFKN